MPVARTRTGSNGTLTSRVPDRSPSRAINRPIEGTEVTASASPYHPSDHWRRQDVVNRRSGQPPKQGERLLHVAGVENVDNPSEVEPRQARELSADGRLVAVLLVGDEIAEAPMESVRRLRRLAGGDYRWEGTSLAHRQPRATLPAERLPRPAGAWVSATSSAFRKRERGDEARRRRARRASRPNWNLVAGMARKKIPYCARFLI